MGDGTFRLVGRNNDTLRFDSAGRLTLISDRHAFDAPDTKGSSVHLYYTAAGDLVRVEDEMGRVFRLSYYERSDSANGGLLKQIEDFSTPARKVAFSYDRRRLSNVTLPDVYNPDVPEGNHTATAITLTYAKGLLAGGAPLHGAAFSSLKLDGYTLPGHTAQRIGFLWDTATGRATSVRAPGVSGWLLAYQGPTADPATRVDVTEPSTLTTTYLLENGRVTERDRSFEVSKGSTAAAPGPPVSTAVRETATYLDDGRVKTTLRGDGGTSIVGYPAAAARLSLPNAENLTEGVRVTTFSKWGADNLLQTIGDPLKRQIDYALAPTDLSSGGVEVDSGFMTDGVKQTTKFDPFGRLKELTGGGKAVADTTVVVDYKDDALGRSKAGFPLKTTQGPVQEKYGYDDDRGLPNHVDTSYGVSHEIHYDEWDRPIWELLGQPTGPVSVAAVNAKVLRGFDEAGRLAVEIRRLTQPDGTTIDARTEYQYNERDQVTLIRRNQVAGAAPGSLTGGFAETKLDYDTSTGFLKSVTSPEGYVTTYEFDRMGRLKSVTPPGSATLTFGYDEMGRPTYSTDGTTTWGGTYDVWGGLTGEVLPGGGGVTRTFDDAGGLTTARLADRTTGEVLSRVEDVTVTSFGEATSMTQVQDAAGAQKLVVARSFDASGRFLEQTSGGRTDLKLGYEKGSGRVLTVGDSVSQVGLGYAATNGPWADSYDFHETQTGVVAPLNTVHSDVTRDAFGRVRTDARSDGTFAETRFDEASRLLSAVDGASASLYSWDARGSLVTGLRDGLRLRARDRPAPDRPAARRRDRDLPVLRRRHRQVRHAQRWREAHVPLRRRQARARARRVRRDDGRRGREVHVGRRLAAHGREAPQVERSGPGHGGRRRARRLRPGRPPAL